MKKLVPYILVAASLASCKPSVSDNLNGKPGNADFTTYISLGDTYTAGFADNSLYLDGQENSYAVRLSDQFKAVGMKGNFVQALLPGESGYPDRKLTLQQTTNCHGDAALLPELYTGAIDTNGSISNISAQGPFNNQGVPFMRAIDYPVKGYANLAVILKNKAYAKRMYRDINGSPMDELTYTMNNLKPTFFTNWLGTTDILGYAIGGGQGNGNGNALPIGVVTNLYDNNDISNPGVFQQNYNNIVTQLVSNGAKGALINIPEITELPFFNTVPINALPLTAEEAQALSNQYAGKGMTFTASANNYFVIKDHNNVTRQAQPGELVLLTIPLDSLMCYGYGGKIPIPAIYVLTADEIANIKESVTTLNGFIQSAAKAHNLAYVDMNSFMKTIKSGIIYNAVTFNAVFASGGAYSLDGIHFTQRGHALAANYILQTINSYYGSTIPMVSVNKYDGVIFP